MTIRTWTDDRIEHLRVLAADGLSASAIAAGLGGGMSRNAVIGKLHRLGLAPTGRTVAAKPGRPKVTKTRRHPFNQPRALALALETAAPIIELPPDQSPDACTIIQLTSESCRWPLGEPSPDMLYCGSQKWPGSSYCARHARLSVGALREVGSAP